MLATATANVFAQTNFPAAREIAAGPFQPTWESLAAQYQCPEWFRDAKFGIWAVGPQCQPEDGDWYARNMYQQGSPQNKSHVEHYGPPSKFGFKDIIPLWKGENFHPDELLAFYKKSGAKYFWPWPTITTTLTCMIQSISRGTPSPSARRKTSSGLGAGGAEKRAAFCRECPCLARLVVVRAGARRGPRRSAGGGALRRQTYENGRQRTLVGRS